MSVEPERTGVDGQEGSANMMIFVVTMFMVPLGLLALYLYVSVHSQRPH
jgi:hypothetical protein